MGRAYECDNCKVLEKGRPETVGPDTKWDFSRNSTLQANSYIVEIRFGYNRELCNKCYTELIQEALAVAKVQ